MAPLNGSGNFAMLLAGAFVHICFISVRAWLAAGRPDSRRFLTPIFLGWRKGIGCRQMLLLGL